MTTEDVRERVLAAAVEVLAENGVRRLTQTQVAEKAGVRQSHLTYYFPRRADLIHAIAGRYVESAAVEIMELFQRAENEDLRQLLIGFAYKQVSDRRRARGLLGLLVESEEDEVLREQMVQSVGTLRMVIAQAMGVQPGDPAATLLQATLWGLGINNLLMGDGDESELKGLIDRAAEQTGLVSKRRRASSRKGAKR